MKKKISKEYLALGGLATITLLSGAALSSIRVNADDSVVDDVSITVPVSCSMSGVVDTAHTATINNGIYSAATGSDYENGIGKTTLTTYCNDYNGFSIYAIGYTNNTEGTNTLIGQSTGQTINTAVYTSGDTTSSWSMKLTKVTDTSTSYLPNNLTITNSFDSYHTVPTEYTQVATYHANTGSSATDTVLGSKLETTYAAYISNTQVADTYEGKVKYVLVHPYNGDTPVHEDQIGVSFDGNGNTFSSGGTKNRVVYAMSPMYEGTTATISKSSNVNNDGTQNGAYYTGEEVNTLDPITLTGADKIKVVLQYGLTANSGEVLIAEGNWDGDSSITGPYYDFYSDSENLSGTNTYIFDGDTITIAMWAWDTPATGYDYGYYAQVYPIYETEQEGTIASTDVYTATADTGTYATTTTWYGSWYADINGNHYDFMNENEITSFLEDNASTLLGTTINLYRGLTFTEAYTNASKTQTGGYYVAQDLNTSMCNTIAITQNQTLIDTRDSNTYLVGKLKDGNCWMLDNLRLDPTDSTTAVNMNANNTNATTEAITNYLNGGNSGGNTGWSSTAVANVTSNFNSYTAPMINNASKNTLVTSYGPASTNGQAKVGIYYNYCAATVSTYCYEGGSGVDVADTIIDAPQDLCPANWRMPTGGSSGEYLALYNKYNTTQDATSTASLQYNLSTPLSGYYIDSSAVDQGSWGYWWSSTYCDGFNMYRLYVNSTGVNPGSYGGRYYGYTMRCLVGD